jgi:tetratricopeptide (TPR) repeat protein
MLEQLKDVPEEESPSDVHFNRAVEAFGNGDFAGAAEEFRAAVILSPDDIILPFTYCQALFAGGQYAHAASVLRAALSEMPEGNETIYYPRGLYADENVLTAQIDSLAAATKTEPFNSDFQLLLGYQLLGMGKVDEAVEPLTVAAKDPANTASAELLMGLVEKVKADKAKEQSIE